ncbi:ABC transporter permease (plasmid) [Paroceanicella profunda]|uniref:ABC transporter permease n=1 Tax=Paroceanicella profunda TaxID=2579971 RepID=A0A5B8G1I9_9RHOB|nr:ABC transporter permease [Paroceanicella profunda]QDL93894.1 ABC transporter permease [Paroceanicella profunda]
MTATDAPPQPARPGGARLVRLASLAGLLGLWALAALLAQDPGLMPGPWVVGPLLWQEAASGRLWLHLGATLARVAAAFVLAMGLGTALGLAMGRAPRLDRWLDPWLVVLLNLPALVTIVLCYIWIGLTETAAITAVALNKVPMVTAMLREGARALDPGLDAMARVFAMPPGTRLRHVLLPQLAPHLAAAARTGLALIWKIVLVVEFLGRSSGVGFQIHLYFQLFDVGMVLAYALAFVAVMLAIEALVLRPWEARARRWRAP